VEEIKECPEEEALSPPLESPRVMRYSGAWKQGSKNHWRMSPERSTSRPVLDVTTPVDVKAIRTKLKLSQSEFASDWEIGESPTAEHDPRLLDRDRSRTGSG
jgi:hypothetical protein